MHAQVGIIGAGPAGATAARRLATAGVGVVAFDKGRGPGGRCSTRRSPSPGFDHGAPVISAGRGGAAFEAVQRSWIDRGIVAPWKGTHRVLKSEGFDPLTAPERYVGVPGMSVIVADLLSDIDVRFGARADRIEQDDGTWRVNDDNGDRLGTFDALIVALPAVQAQQLLAGVADDLAAVAAGSVSEPRWSCMIRTNGPTGANADSVRIDNGGPLSFIANETSKPGRSADGDEHWVIHGSAAWSAEHLELDKPEAADLLAGVWRRTLEHLGATRTDIAQVSGHRWRYALTSRPHGQPIATDPAAALVVCGDWLLGDAIGDAIRSGDEAAQAVTPMLR